MADDELWGCVGGVLVAVLVVAAIVVAVISLMTIGSFFGAGIALKNYYLAFRNNVQLERATP